MLAWVVAEDLLNDVCGLSLFGFDLDRDGYGGSAKSINVLIRRQLGFGCKSAHGMEICVGLIF